MSTFNKRHIAHSGGIGLILCAFNLFLIWLKSYLMSEQESSKRRKNTENIRRK